MNKLYLLQSKIDNMIEKLLKKIPKNFSIIVGIENGGVHISKKIAHTLQIPHTSVRISCYQNEQLREHVYIENNGFNVHQYACCLIVDDLVDRGTTIINFKKYFGFRNGIDAVATLFYKPHSSCKPDFYVEETNKWCVFPWEF